MQHLQMNHYGITEVPQGEDIGKGPDHFFKERVAKNVPDLGKEMEIRLRKPKRSP